MLLSWFSTWQITFQYEAMFIPKRSSETSGEFSGTKVTELHRIETKSNFIAQSPNLTFIAIIYNDYYYILLPITLFLIPLYSPLLYTTYIKCVCCFYKGYSIFTHYRKQTNKKNADPCFQNYTIQRTIIVNLSIQLFLLIWFPFEGVPDRKIERKGQRTSVCLLFLHIQSFFLYQFTFIAAWCTMHKLYWHIRITPSSIVTLFILVVVYRMSLDMYTSLWYHTDNVSVQFT